MCFKSDTRIFSVVIFLAFTILLFGFTAYSVAAKSDWEESYDASQGILHQVDTKAEDEDEVFDEVSHDERADLAQESLFNHFWNKQLKMFNNAYECRDCNSQFHYWWQAHALDTLIDGYERTKDDVYLERAATMFNGIVEQNNGIINEFYDDMLWMSLATFRLYQQTDDEQYEQAVLKLWGNIKSGWNNAQGGGIAWHKRQMNYKNTPSNAPAVILAARLYEHYEDEDYLEWAKKIYDWQLENLVEEETGYVWDGINREDNGEIDKDWKFTYNQGVFIGASVELYKVTGEERYLELALRTMTYVVDHFANQDYEIYESGSGDGGLFKGILVRYLTLLAIESKGNEALEQLIVASAKSAWDQIETPERIVFGPSWLFKPQQPVELSQQLSGVMLMEQAALLENHLQTESADVVIKYLLVGILIVVSISFLFWLRRRNIHDH